MISVGHMGNMCLSDEIPYSIQIWESVETLDPHVEQGGLKTQDRHFSYVGHMWTICSIYFQYAGHMWTIHSIQQIYRRKIMCEKHGNMGGKLGMFGTIILRATEHPHQPYSNMPYGDYVSHMWAIHLDPHVYSSVIITQPVKCSYQC